MQPGELTADLRLEAGELAPGSRLVLRAPPPSAGKPFTASLAVEATAPPRLALAFDAPGFTVPRRDGGPPWLTTDELGVTGSTGERRLARLLAVAREAQQVGRCPVTRGDPSRRHHRRPR